MSIKVVCIHECKGTDVSASFSIGDILNMSEVPLDIGISLVVLFKVKPKDCCIIDEEPKINGEWAVWLKKYFAPISDIDEIEMNRNYQRVDSSLYKALKNNAI